jgi:nucleotidyltransferase AbiEii toxin of type IV toxin-antitoxin system
MTLHLEILTEQQQEVLRRLGPVATEEGFYLAGGTSIALVLGHRQSDDFDWFLEGDIPDPLSLARRIQEKGISFVTGQIARGTLYGTVHGVRVSFIEFRYGLLDSFILWPDFGCRLAGLKDLACMKLSAIAQRGARKDFIDLYALLREGLSLADMLGWYQEKFNVREVGHVVYSLAYFADAEAEPMPRMIWNADWRQVKQTVQEATRRISS